MKGLFFTKSSCESELITGQKPSAERRNGFLLGEGNALFTVKESGLRIPGEEIRRVTEAFYNVWTRPGAGRRELRPGALFLCVRSAQLPRGPGSVLREGGEGTAVLVIFPEE